MDAKYRYYVALVWLPSTGQIVNMSSPDLAHRQDDILRGIAPKLMDHIQLLTNNGKQHSAFDRQLASTPKCCKRKHDESASREQEFKRRKLGTSSESENIQSLRERTSPRSDQCLLTKEQELLTYPVNAQEKWKSWFSDAFRAVQQVNCRIIAKQWIKTIHPRKQDTHPYNGWNPVSKRWEGPDSTKPPYWPTGVVHKGPDHIRKEDRIKLLVHLLTTTPHREISVKGESVLAPNITAEVLKQSLDWIKQEQQYSELREKMSIVGHIIEARAKLEDYESGLISPSFTISVPDFGDDALNQKEATSMNASFETSTDFDDQKCDLSETCVGQQDVNLNTGTLKPLFTANSQDRFACSSVAEESCDIGVTNFAPQLPHDPPTTMTQIDPLLGVQNTDLSEMRRKYSQPTVFSAPDSIMTWETFPYSLPLQEAAPSTVREDLRPPPHEYWHPNSNTLCPTWYKSAEGHYTSLPSNPTIVPSGSTTSLRNWYPGLYDSILHPPLAFRESVLEIENDYAAYCQRMYSNFNRSSHPPQQFNRAVMDPG